MRSMEVYGPQRAQQGSKERTWGQEKGWGGPVPSCEPGGGCTDRKQQELKLGVRAQMGHQEIPR